MRLSVQNITQEAMRASRDEFVARVNAPLLIELAIAVNSTAKRDFLTEAITEAELAAQVQAARDASVYLIRKCAGGLFSGHIGVGRTANLDIPIARPGMSKFHAYFSTTPDGQYQLTDKGSKNGTFVDELRLTPGVPVDITDGAVIRFAVHSFRFMTAAAFYHTVHGTRSERAPRRSDAGAARRAAK